MAFIEWLTAFYDRWFQGPTANFIAAIIIILIGFMIGKLLGRLVTKILQEVELNKILRAAGLKISLEKTLGSLVSYIAYFITVVAALYQFHIAPTIVYIIIISLGCIIILSILLAIKDFIPNLICGIIIKKKKPVKAGDKIKIGKTEGRIKKISLVQTLLETKEKDIVYIPNSVIIRKNILKIKK
ncbi:MAG: mechanosensitive ion channel family protein [Nanoarchaeota archaeon]|nr:mechanosensitive ion channel family protein [Nanoarchaeota archaeon]